MKLDTIATTHRAETLLNNIMTDAQWKFFKPAENHLDLLNAKHAIADKVKTKQCEQQMEQQQLFSKQATM